MSNTFTPNETAQDIGRRLRQLGREIIDPMICRTPAYGAPGWPHCAACCGGTGIVLTCHEDEEVFNVAEAMVRIADLFDPEGAGYGRSRE